MDLRASLLSEHSRAMTSRIVNYVGSDSRRFRDLAGLFFEGDPALSRRAAWPLGDIGVAHPELAKPFAGKLIAVLQNEGGHPAIPRNLLRVLIATEIPEKHCGLLFDTCLRFLCSEAVDIAIRALSVTMAARIALRYPDLAHELLPILQSLAALPQSPAVSHRLRKAMKELSAIKAV